MIHLLLIQFIGYIHCGLQDVREICEKYHDQSQNIAYYEGCQVGKDSVLIFTRREHALTSDFFLKFEKDFLSTKKLFCINLFVKYTKRFTKKRKRNKIPELVKILKSLNSPISDIKLRKKVIDCPLSDGLYSVMPIKKFQTEYQHIKKYFEYQNMIKVYKSKYWVYNFLIYIQDPTISITCTFIDILRNYFLFGTTYQNHSPHNYVMAFIKNELATQNNRNNMESFEYFLQYYKNFEKLIKSYTNKQEIEFRNNSGKKIIDFLQKHEILLQYVPAIWIGKTSISQELGIKGKARCFKVKYEFFIYDGDIISYLIIKYNRIEYFRKSLSFWKSFIVLTDYYYDNYGHNNDHRFFVYYFSIVQVFTNKRIIFRFHYQNNLIQNIYMIIRNDFYPSYRFCEHKISYDDALSIINEFAAYGNRYHDNSSSFI